MAAKPYNLISHRVLKSQHHSHRHYHHRNADSDTKHRYTHSRPADPTIRIAVVIYTTGYVK